MGRCMADYHQHRPMRVHALGRPEVVDAVVSDQVCEVVLFKKKKGRWEWKGWWGQAQNETFLRSKAMKGITVALWKCLHFFHLIIMVGLFMSPAYHL